ncbi:MAG TPA: PilZ domain-containing protein [Thermoanaerobaculia bacterium]|nr:PilZ domain-containing protein [Thermoanaerobaculia bacterium]
MQPKGEERREFQRLRLEEPISGTFAATPVTLVEIGILGARIHHDGALSGNRGDLCFSAEGHDVTMRCDVVRTFPVPGGFASGLRFLAAIGESGDHLRAMLARLVAWALEHRFDSEATRLRIKAVDGDKTVRGIDAQFLSYRFDRGSWQRRNVFLPEQPHLGFTVAKGEDPDEMQRLCAVYEASDDEGRRLIRLFAELSVSEVLQIPPRS